MRIYKGRGLASEAPGQTFTVREGPAQHVGCLRKGGRGLAPAAAETKRAARYRKIPPTAHGTHPPTRPSSFPCPPESHARTGLS